MFTVNVVNRLDQRQLAELYSYMDRRFARIEGQLIQLRSMGDNLTKTSEQILDVLGKIDVATDEVAKDLADLRTQITGGLSATEAEAVNVRLATLQTRLEGMGKDPQDPAPVVPAATAETTGTTDPAASGG